MYNNYGYNPYQNRYMGVAPMQQPIQQPQQIIPVQQNNLNGKIVESLEVVKAMDIPMDGSISYFPIADGSAIISKQLQMDGTSKTLIYKPATSKQEEIKYITQEDLKKAINEIDLSEIDDIREELSEIKKQLKKKSVKDE